LVNAAKDKCQKDLPLYLRFLTSLFELCDAVTSVPAPTLHQRIKSALGSTTLRHASKSSRCTWPEGSEELLRCGSIDTQDIVARTLGKGLLVSPVSFAESLNKGSMDEYCEAAYESSIRQRKRKRRQSVSSSQTSEKSQISIWSPGTVASTPLTANSVGEELIDKCQICQTEFTGERDSRKGNIARHMKSCHGNNEKFGCDCCNSRYNRQDNLLQHKRECYPKNGREPPRKRVKS